MAKDRTYKLYQGDCLEVMKNIPSKSINLVIIDPPYNIGKDKWDKWDTVEDKKTIKDYGIDEKDFLDRLDEMSEQAFDDQCTGANPRYPLISEIKEMYLKAYYGKE